MGWPISWCRSCNAKVIWGYTKNSKRMCVDADPIVGGNVVLTTGNDGPNVTVLTAAETTQRKERGDKVYVSHFTTCPNAGSHRRG